MLVWKILRGGEINIDTMGRKDHGIKPLGQTKMIQSTLCFEGCHLPVVVQMKSLMSEKVVKQAFISNWLCGWTSFFHV